MIWPQSVLSAEEARGRLARDLREARGLAEHRAANGMRTDSVLVMTPIAVAEALLGESDLLRSGVGADRTAPQDGEPGTASAWSVNAENDARPLAKPNASAPVLIPADCDATRALAAMRAPAGDALRIRLEYFATLHPLAVAPRRFEYHREGCDLVEIVTRCLHWWSAVGERVTVLDAAQVEGTCPYCAFSDDCDCEAGRRALYLYAGAEFVDVKHLGGEPSQGFYWRLLPIAATEE